MITLAQLEPFGETSCAVSMKKHTTYKIGGVADFLVEAYGIEQLRELIQLLNRENVPWLILGNGSNVLIDDVPFHGVVISLKKYFKDFHFEDDILTCQAGCSIIALSVEAMMRSLSGLEFASGIPGSIGGGIYMNAGAYLSDMASILIDVTVLKDGEIVTMTNEELDFTYRHSNFQKHKDWVALSARFQLEYKPKNEIQETMDRRKQRRLTTQPVSKPSAGSVFRNPKGCNAWQIVDQLGYRGKSIGGAIVSPIHSNFIVNEGNATARDVDRLIRNIQRDALKHYGIHLITEVERINWHGETDEIA
ncbi:MAG: UDP-N-acetylmuramate dehydrogenase [Erysipelotrichaceae bacterium]|nr:UDP-N-acetylmuramate dehydrogenase [Erysipelotrichaceae bacterium]